MELSSEDSLRLQVLLKNVHAVRIDEQAMTVFGLSARGEAKVPLNPNCRPDQYLRRVREFFSGTVLGSPGGYPVHLNRWTRMGQTKDTYLAELLMLGEPEAVIAVAGAPGLTDELARRAWWVMPQSDNARRMLERDCIVQGQMGKVLADHLVEHLPFEDDSRVVIETVRLVLQPGLIEEPMRVRLWEKGTRQAAYRCGFLEATPNSLPQPLPARDDRDTHVSALTALADQGNPFAALLVALLDAQGQTFLDACDAVLARPTDQNVVVSLVNSVGRYFAPARAIAPRTRDLAQIVADTEAAFAVQAVHPALASARAAVARLPALAAEFRALVVLAQVDEAVVTDILARTSAIGTVLRKKLEPITNLIQQQFAALHTPRNG